MLGLSRGFEISEWGAHDVVEGQMRFSPSSIAHVLATTDAHPYSFDHVPSSQVSSIAELNEIRDGSLRGIESRGGLAQRLIDETRPDLAMIVFPETHHAGHYLWHTVAPGYPYYDDELRQSAKTGPTFADIYCALDRQLEKLLRVVSEDARIMVFSLHGLRPTYGIPDFLPALMCDQGFAALTSWTNQTWRERSRSLIGAVKSHMPVRLKKIYYRTVPKQITYRIAQPTMMPSYDWSRTTAFALQSDQHGRIRINLAGREAQGIVPLEQYEETCRKLVGWLRSLTTDDGQPLVDDVINTAASPAAAIELPLPDLIVHLSDAAQKSPLRIKGSAVVSHPVSTKYSGQHDWEGFCVAVGGMPTDQEAIQAKDLHRLLVAGL
jgi:predicted AlkP superfamily phosphohydrolase/phosphomutase